MTIDSSQTIISENYREYITYLDELLFRGTGPEVIKRFSYSAQVSMKFVLLLNLKLLTIVNSFLLNIDKHENVFANKYKSANYCWNFHIYLQRKFHAQLSWSWTKFYNLGAWIHLIGFPPYFTSSCGNGTKAIIQTRKSVNKWRIRMFRPTDMDPRIKGVIRRPRIVSITW